MKRRLPFMLLTIVLLILLAACGQSENQPGENHVDDGISSDHNPDLQTNEQDVHENKPKETKSGVNNEPSNSNSNLHKVNLFFADDELLDMYKEEVEIEGSNDELAKKALETWIAGPKSDKLVSLVPNTVKVQSIENKDGVAYVSFSKEFLAANVGSSGELMLLDQVALIMQQFNYPKTQILIEGEMKEELFGHMTTNEPIEAQDPSNYETIQ